MMEKNSRKEKLVKQLLNKDFDVTDEDELIEMLLDNHATQKQGCPKCGKESMAKIHSLKLDDFITRSIETHNNLYSYDKVTKNTLKNGSSIVEIYCKKCKKYFSQQAKIHIAGSGCTICYRK